MKAPYAALDAADLSRVRHVALDMDGTLYRGGTLFPFTLPFLDKLRAMGLGVSFLTNNCSKSTREYIGKLASMGISADCGSLRTSAHSAIDYLREYHPLMRRVYVVGTPGLREELSGASYHVVEEAPEIVVVGYDPDLSFAQLCRAGFWIQRGVPYIATHPDRVCPTDQPTLLLDCAALCAALFEATGRRPLVTLGKPHALMLGGLLSRLGLEATDLLMVGDRLYTDVAMARSAGALGALVLSGEATAEDVARASDCERPHFVFADLAELGEALEAARADLSKNYEHTRPTS